MPQRSQAVLEPRKSPVQARSAATVDAILEATIQVLLQVGFVVERFCEGYLQAISDKTAMPLCRFKWRE